MRFLVFLFLVLGTSIGARACDDCPENEVYSECGANGCQNTCANPTLSMVCKAMCIEGCVCVEGYLRDANGKCVAKDDCPKSEGGDEDCEVITEKPTVTKKPPTIQTKPTKRPTTPKPDDEDDCDLPTKKPTVTKKPPTIKTKPTKATKPPTKATKPPTKKTRPPTPPKPQCDKNEVYDLCGNTGCVNTCAEPDLITRCTPAGCTPGCICKEGFLRNFSRQCVSPDECPTCSGPNEVYNCGSACDTTCATLGERCPIVNVKCTEMCYCMDGYARNDEGVCIPIEQCPPRECPTDPNAIIVPCGDPCPTTCENKDDGGVRICAAICIVNGCKCKDGYVLGADGMCTLARNCPSKNPPTKATKKPTTKATKPTKATRATKTTPKPQDDDDCEEPTKKTTRATKAPTKKATRKPRTKLRRRSSSKSFSFSYSYSFSSSRESVPKKKLPTKKPIKVTLKPIKTTACTKKPTPAPICLDEE